MTDSSAVAVYKEGLVAHVLFNLASSISSFLKGDTNKAFAKVVGDKGSKGAGYVQEAPCVYSLYGSRPYVDKRKKLVDSLVGKDWSNS